MNVMSAVMTVLGKPNLDWASIQKEMSDPKFLNKFIEFDKDNVPDRTLQAVKAYTDKEDFLPQIVKQKSVAAAAMCSWVRALVKYSELLAIIRPKIEEKERLQQQLNPGSSNPQLEEVKEIRPAKKGKKKGKAPRDFGESPERARVQTMMA